MCLPKKHNWFYRCIDLRVSATLGRAFPALSLHPYIFSRGLEGGKIDLREAFYWYKPGCKESKSLFGSMPKAYDNDDTLNNYPFLMKPMKS